MKHVLTAFVVVLTVGACSHTSAAKCDNVEKRQLTEAVEEATLELAAAERAFGQYGGVVTLQNGDGYGTALERRTNALTNAQRRVADLGAYAKQHPRCLTKVERDALTTADQQINER